MSKAKYISPRNVSIFRSVMTGNTLEVTAKNHGISRERSRQIVVALARLLWFKYNTTILSAEACPYAHKPFMLKHLRKEHEVWEQALQAEGV